MQSTVIIEGTENDILQVFLHACLNTVIGGGLKNMIEMS